MIGIFGRIGFVSALTLILVTMTSGTALATLSAVRKPGTLAQDYIRATKKSLVAAGKFSPSARSVPVVYEKGSFEKAAWERVPTVSSADLQLTFEKSRDEKVFEDPIRSHVERRRPSWLFPDDGCFVRAVIAADTVQKSLGQNAAKIFAFGELNVKTDNALTGYVEWWYHVAAIAKVTTKDGDAFFVYDPAMSPKKPMEVSEWLKSMGDRNLEIAICSGNAYDPDSDCARGEADPLSRAISEAPLYLSYEWERLEQLKRDPVRELGAFPPWQ